ncbi:KHG/KDPG aldolase [Rubrobacter xylanophilus DSM 9941]|uniref:bifunctional 4-hydroxy-2-oxoglutarate aldolase/2-dehydro-3-deoxy-phosphogluconate aldolase n=1 Tax=Rubrobacter xylanophilus TaxID=49319 RepID=UPI001C63D7CA|nr:bifunctional 4-hydroxy-2-oxoglutarate aldolase/2-dehydro-3-deoxy-phosphogluconate aldolase [Rubrobacter xylanophilus]QYJ17126.1 KHG/KDPG aldolase [Rubrobacter xylanophilus DSM 9941]
MDKAMILERIRQIGLLAVLRAPDPESALRTVESLVEAGVVGIEVTYSTPDVAAVISRVTESYGEDVLVGAGTVLAPEQAVEAADAGASFLVSPGLDDELVAAMLGTGLLTMAGVLTPSEVIRARRLGVDVLKLFPGSLGGPPYLKSLRGPFPEVSFVPTGGVSAQNAGEWILAGAIAVGAGGELASAAEMRRGDFKEIREKGRRFVAAIREARAGMAGGIS